jgi:hypothetical protein
MKVTYHGQNYTITDEHVTRWLAARELPTGVYTLLRDGKPLSGTRNEVYPDDTVPDGYQIVPAATEIAASTEIQVGTGYLNNGMVGTVTHVGECYDMAVEHGVTDEDHSYSGFRATGHTIVSVKRVYFRA